MSSPLTEHVLFTTLREYASRLEVQYMIEEEVKKFHETVLPRLLSGACATALRETKAESAADGRTDGAADRRVSSPSPPATAAPSCASAILNPEWVQTFLKAHVDDVVGRQLPVMIAHEVQRQLRRANERAQAESSEAAPSPSSGSWPCGTAAGGRTHPHTPALPLSPPRPPRVPPREATAESVEKGPTKHQRDDYSDFTLAAATTRDEGRRQREQILNAIADIERRLKITQHDLNGVVHQQRLSRCRLEYLCESLKGVNVSPATESEPSSLCAALEQALDDRQADVVRVRLAAIFQGLLLQWTESHPGRESGAHGHALSTHGSSPSPARQVGQPPHASSVSAESNRLPSCSRYTSPQQLTRSPSRLYCHSPSPLPVETGAVRAPLAQPPCLLETAPVSLALSSAGALPYSRHCDAAATDAEAAPSAVAPPTRAVRSIKTRGTVTSAATGKAVASTAPPSMQQPPALKMVNATAPFSPPMAPEQSPAPPDVDGAALLLVPLSKECVDTSMRERARRGTRASIPMRAVDAPVPTTASAASPVNCTNHSTAPSCSSVHHNMSSSSITSAGSSRENASSRVASRALVLGIEAVNIPSGVLPGAISRRGAVRVVSVAPRQLAERAGLCRGDVLLSVDHRPVGSCEELKSALAAVPATQLSVAVELNREAIHQTLFVTVPL
ncbi:hypothetical protein GH5_06888 [Leishmania sp. Ghana 2012 LV757]|uniref:hypothetical protein n=1 Tax=Leishmania sp. Ghana 2012 LV757 TaxID=2803181 RepID=UPI001B6D62A1|nr:hypothetical protein GH5_06888 [Leishmania sp. Ghana 2012 LV757]